MVRLIALLFSLISNGNRTEWSTIQGEIGWVISNQQSLERGWLEITSTITPELYDTKSYHQLLIVSITKCKKLSKSTVEKKAFKI